MHLRLQFIKKPKHPASSFSPIAEFTIQALRHQQPETDLRTALSKKVP